MSDDPDDNERVALERAFDRLGARYRVSTATYHATYCGAPPNVQILLEQDPLFQTSCFCSSAYDVVPQRNTCVARIYPAAAKIVVFGCKSRNDCVRVLDTLREALGTLHVLDIRCILMNINIDLPYTLNNHMPDALEKVPQVTLVEQQERHPATIVHINLHGQYTKKALVYPKSGKVSLHTSSWRDSRWMWAIMHEALQESRGFSKAPNAE